MDVIELRDIRVYGKHGANPGEREHEQPFDVGIALRVDLREAAATDDLRSTVNYADVHARVCSIVRSTSFALIERLAEAIVDELFQDARITHADVRVAKPQLLDGATPSVTISRDNERFRERSA